MKRALKTYLVVPGSVVAEEDMGKLVIVQGQDFCVQVNPIKTTGEVCEEGSGRKGGRQGSGQGGRPSQCPLVLTRGRCLQCGPRFRAELPLAEPALTSVHLRRATLTRPCLKSFLHQLRLCVCLFVCATEKERAGLTGRVSLSGSLSSSRPSS